MTVAGEDIRGAEHTGNSFLFQRRFLPMFTGFTLGVFTDNMLKQALLIGLTYSLITLPWVSNPQIILPVAGALFAFAVLVFSPISGQVADKYETSMLFRRTKFAELILMLTAAVGFFLNNGPLLILILFLMGVQSAFFSPARIGGMPKYLRADELVRGNGICYGGLFVANLTGYAVGGGLIELPNGPALISLILVGFALAGWLAVLLAPYARADSPELKIDWNIFAQTARMISMVAAEPPVVRPLLGGGFFWFIAAAITVAFPLITLEVLHAKGTVATAMMAIFAIGGLIGAAVTSMIPKQNSGLGYSTLAFITAIVVNIILFAICQGMMGTQDGDLLTLTEFFSLPGGIALALLFIIASASMGIFLVPLQAAIQRRVQEHHRARIMASANMLNAAAAVLGSTSVLALALTPMRPHDLFLMMAVLELGVVIYMYRRRTAVPEGLYDEMLAQKETAPDLSADPVSPGAEKPAL